MKLILIISLSCIFFRSYCQDSIKPSIPPHPKRAALLSTIIPGAGQIYNQIYAPKKKYNAYWKVPLIYGSLIGSTNLLLNAIKTEKELKQEYYNRINNVTPSVKWVNYDKYNLLTLHNSASRNRNLLYILVGGLYILQIADASIEAHFTHYDISPNLSLDINPLLNPHATGVNLSFNLH